MSLAPLLRKLFLVDLVKGMSVTFQNQSEKERITEQYPLERPVVYRALSRTAAAERESGYRRVAVHRVQSVRAGVPGAVDRGEGRTQSGDQTKEVVSWTYDLSRCMFCGLCEEACSTDALELTQDYEMALYSREGMVLDQAAAGAWARAGEVREMTPVADNRFFFYLLSLAAIIFAIAVITRRNPVHAALSLIVTLLSLAGLYLMLYAPFVAGVQIVLYAGGIMVLFLFVIMLVNLEQNIREIQFNKQWLVGLIAALALGGLLLFVIRQGHAIFPQTCCGSAGRAEHAADRHRGSTGNYMLPFEIASLLLLVAIVGAVVMAKKRI